MKSLFIASGLLAALSGASAQLVTGIPELAAFKPVELNTDYPRQNIEAFTGSYDDCIKRCFNNPVCQAVTLVNEAGSSSGCMLKFAALNDTKNTNFPGRETYVKTTATIANPTTTTTEFRISPVPFGWTPHQGKNYPATAATPLTLSPNQCLDRCERTTGCVAITIDTSNALGCSLKFGTATMTDSTISETYVRLAAVAPPMFTPPGFNFVARSDNGEGLWTATASLGQCERLCSVISGCQGWTTWTFDQSTCHLKKGDKRSSWVSKDTYWKNNNATTLDAFGGVPPPGYNDRPGVNFPGNEISYLDIPFSECIEQCDIRRICRGFSLDKIKGRGCWLKSEMSTWEPYAGRDSYVKTGGIVDSLTTPVGYRAAVGYEFFGNDIGSKLEIPYSECAARCNATANCIVYVLDRLNLTHGCWLKHKVDVATVRIHRDAHLRVGSVPAPADLPNWFDATIRDSGSIALFRSWYLRYNNATDTSYHQKVSFGVNGYGALEWNFHGYAVEMETPNPLQPGSTDASCPKNVKANQFIILSNGRVQINYDRTSCFVGIAQTSIGGWFATTRRNPSNQAQFQAIITNGNSQWIFSEMTLPATQKMYPHALSFGYNGNLINYPTPSPAQNVHDVQIFSMDGLATSVTDLANSISGKYTNANPANFDNTPDDFRHGTISVQLLKTEGSGLAQQSKVSVELVKITSEAGNWFTEKSIVTGIKYAVDHTTTATKIIAMPVAPGSLGWSRKVQCAIEMAYKANIAVIAAAGNDNKTLSSSSPYSLTIGAVCGTAANPTKCGISNLGSKIDLWASGYVITPVQVGTSIATIVVAAIAANLIQRSSTLVKNPGLLYNQIMTDSQTIGSFKVARLSSTSAIVTAALPRIATAVTSCDANTNFDSLLASSDTFPIGRYVSSEGGQAGCNDWGAEEITGGCVI